MGILLGQSTGCCWGNITGALDQGRHCKEILLRHRMSENIAEKYYQNIRTRRTRRGNIFTAYRNTGEITLKFYMDTGPVIVRRYYWNIETRHCRKYY